MKKNTPYFVSGLISLVVILLTGWIAFYSHISILHNICFYFHLVPFGIGFTGGSTLWVILYYFILWGVLTLMMIPIVKIYNYSKHKRLILMSIISVLSLGFFAVFWADNSIKKEREQRISQNEKEDRENFKSLNTGDIIFRTTKKTDSIDNKMAIINVDIHGYTVLEITDRVQHTSLRSWIKNNGNYTIKRLNNADSIFTEKNIVRFRKERQKFIFKTYDNSHCWSDDKIYDSELIWKTYKRALGIELCKLHTSSISSENIPNQENCSDSYYISPTAIFYSKQLLTIMEK